MSEKISIIAPFFNEEQNIKSFYDRLSKTLNGLNLEYEVICVDDGSMDNTFNKLTEINGSVTIDFTRSEINYKNKHYQFSPIQDIVQDIIIKSEYI